MSKPLLVIRSRARGDVLMITPILRALHAQDTRRQIFVQSEFSGLFARNHCAHWYGLKPPFPLGAFDVVNLDRMIFETQYQTHLVDAFAMHAGVATDSRRLAIYPDQRDIETARKLGFQDIVLAPGPTDWAGKNWHPENWQKLAKTLRQRGHRVTLVGAGRAFRTPCDLDLRGRTTFHELAAVLQNTRLFIGIDSFPAHVAAAVSCPSVTLWGITSPHYICCHYGTARYVESDPNHPLTAARHDERVHKLNYKDSPMHTITLDAVLDAVANI